MAAKTDLDHSLRDLAPHARDGRWVLLTLDEPPPFDLRLAVSIREPEGMSVVVAADDADRLGLAYTVVTAWIACAIGNARSSVRVTGVLADALAQATIPCTLIASSRYLHLFVPSDRLDEALVALDELVMQHQRRPAGPHVPRTDGVNEVAIRDGEIRLGQFLKLAGLVDSGSAVKPLLADGRVKVNREPETRRGRQLKVGDVVTVDGRSVAVG